MLISKAASQIQEMYSSMKFGRKIPEYDKFSQNFFKNRLQRETKSQYEVNLERHLKPFQEFKERQEAIIREDIELEEKFKKELVERRINEQKTKAQNLHTFNQEYETEGVDSWKKNMLKKKENQNREFDFQLKEAQKYKTIVDKAIKKSSDEVMNQIDRFEDRMKGTIPEEEQRLTFTNKNRLFLRQLTTKLSILLTKLRRRL